MVLYTEGRMIEDSELDATMRGALLGDYWI